MESHDECLGPERGCGTGIAVDADEQVGVVPVSYGGPFVQFNENIGFSGIDHPNIGEMTFYQSAQFQRNVKRDVFFLRRRTQATGVVTAVTGIDDHRPQLVFGHPVAGCERTEKQP
jgi:hypothetical protein